MFNLPHETEVFHRINKIDIYRKFNFTSAQKSSFDEDIAKISIIHEISDNTLHLSGSDDNAFFILEIQLKKKNYDPKNIEKLSKLIDRNLLLALTCENMVRFAVFKTVLHQNDWQNIDKVELTLNGHNYDIIWENMVRSVIGIENESTESLEEQIETKIDNDRILKDIEKLKSKLHKEKQLNIKMELNAEIRKLEGMIK